MSICQIKEFFVGDPVKVGAQSKAIDTNNRSLKPCAQNPIDKNNAPYAILVGRLKYYGAMKSPAKQQ